MHHWDSSHHQYKHFSEKLTLNGDKCCDISQAYKKNKKLMPSSKRKLVQQDISV